ncbi:methyltransferase [Sphingomonas fuzhouensis]|uniref:methyltransferase n=1 Tax=Sphingomonas fuzhouensis TaxID=3106033 RepID=UPI002AFF0EE0|nr:methyltransferase [Sphingomonas sp. SGZ-02]
MLSENHDNRAALQRGSEPWYDPARRPALLALLGLLDDRGYDFVTPTPATHARVVKRPDRRSATSLRDVLGWSLAFDRDLLDPAMSWALEEAGAIQPISADRWAPTLRVSRVGAQLYLHSAYPTTQADAVFLGPDSYRFARWIAENGKADARTVMDYGAGAGVGGISAASGLAEARLTLADINPKALFLAGINAEHAGIAHDTIEAHEPPAIGRRFDLIVTHPPFMIDADRRAYRDGGDLYGARLSLDWVVQGVRLLTPGGRLILHTGVSIVDGRDVLLDELRRCLPEQGLAMRYVELDPDIFSEDLDQPGYEQVERIAAIGLMIERDAAS